MLVLASILGCGVEEEISIQPQPCGSLYMPIYENVYENTLKPTCGQAGVACHAPEGAHGGFIISDIDSSYSLLIDGNWAKPKEPLESPIVHRMESADPERLMPPGQALSPAELCAIETWILQGALR